MARLKGDAAHGRAPAWPPPVTTCASRPRTCRWPRPGVGCGSRRQTWPRRWRRSWPATCRSRPAATRSARGSGGSPGSGHPDSKWEDAAPVGRLRRRDAHQHRAQHRRGADLAVAVGAGAREARPHEPPGARAGRRGAPRRRRAAARCCAPSGAKRLDDEPWSLPELVLVDEAEAVLNGVGRTYGHAVVDEAQDLSAMELRAVARRCPSRSMTVLGDLAQATAPGAQSSWDDAVVHLGSPPTASIEELELGYRVPAPILDVANRLLPEVAPGVRAARSVRLDGPPPELVPTDPGRSAAAHRRRGARPGHRLVVRGARRARAVARAGGRRPRARRGSTFGTGTRGGLAGEPSRSSTRPRRRASSSTPSWWWSRARSTPTSGAAGSSTSRSPGRCRRSPSSTPTRSRRPSPPDEGARTTGSTLGPLAAPRTRRHRAQPLPPIRLDHGRRGRRARRGRAWPSCPPCRASATPAAPTRR